MKCQQGAHQQWMEQSLMVPTTWPGCPQGPGLGTRVRVTSIPSESIPFHTTKQGLRFRFASTLKTNKHTDVNYLHLHIIVE